jgi:hypothetical protein
MGLGNYFLGIHLSDAGVFGMGFTGPVPFLILIGYRVVEAIRNQYLKGTPVDMAKTNWFVRLDNKLMFKRRNLVALAGNFIPNLIILLCLTLSFKYAALGGMN